MREAKNHETTALAAPLPAHLSKLLLDHGFIAEEDLSFMRDERAATTVTKRRRGELPPHYLYGQLVVYRVEDVIEDIENSKFKPRSSKGRGKNSKTAKAAIAADILGTDAA